MTPNPEVLASKMPQEIICEHLRVEGKAHSLLDCPYCMWNRAIEECSKVVSFAHQQTEEMRKERDDWKEQCRRTAVECADKVGYIREFQDIIKELRIENNILNSHAVVHANSFLQDKNLELQARIKELEEALESVNTLANAEGEQLGFSLKAQRIVQHALAKGERG